MNTLADTGILVGTGLCGWLAFRLCRIPMPAFLGLLIFAGGLNYFYLYPDLPLETPFFLSKALIGVTLGRRFDREIMGELRELPLPALITALWMMGASLTAGFLLYALSDVSLATALIGSAAGGIAEMTIFAVALGADMVIVAFVQVFRLVFAILAIPFVARAWARHAARSGKAAPPEPKRGHARSQGRFRRQHYGLMVTTALIGSGLFEWLHIPAGAMLGAMGGTAIVVIASGRDCVLPRRTSSVAQFGISIIVAKGLTHDTIVTLSTLFGPLFIPTFVLLVLCLTLSLILKRLTRWDDMTCILATMPAGLIQIVPVADEYGADVLKVGVLHVVRLVSVIVVLPWIIRLIIV